MEERTNGNGISRRTFIQAAGIGAASVLMSGFSPLSAAEKYPSDTITIIVPFSVGGGTDGWARTFAAAMARKNLLRANVVVNNLPGGADLRGIGEAFHAKPDGYTLVAFNPPSSPWAWYIHQPNWDIRKLVGITVYAKDPQVLVVHKDYEYQDFESLRKAAKAGKVNKIGLSGIGGIEHVCSELCSRRLEVPWKQYITYNACSDVAAALYRKEINAAFCSLGAFGPGIDEGRLVPIAIAGVEKRSSLLPDVPTFKELGDPLDVCAFNRSIYAPPGLPKEIQKILEENFIKAQKTVDIVQARYKSYGLEPALGTGEDAERYVEEAIKVAEELDLRKLVRGES